MFFELSVGLPCLSSDLRIISSRSILIRVTHRLYTVVLETLISWNPQTSQQLQCLFSFFHRYVTLYRCFEIVSYQDNQISRHCCRFNELTHKVGTVCVCALQDQLVAYVDI